MTQVGFWLRYTLTKKGAEMVLKCPVLWGEHFQANEPSKRLQVLKEPSKLKGSKIFCVLTHDLTK